MNLYITADQIGAKSGGGTVTYHESEALKSLGACDAWDRHVLGSCADPWGWDEKAVARLAAGDLTRYFADPIKLTHFYAGTFSGVVQSLKQLGVKVSYTAAAHDVEKSKKAHEEAGYHFDYPHLTDPALWRKYVAGYLAADVLICPSALSASIMRSYGARNRVEVIPHGVDLPKCPSCGFGGNPGYLQFGDSEGYVVDEEWCDTCGPEDDERGLAKIAPLPERFTVGYLGAIGPDKGVAGLLQAWRRHMDDPKHKGHMLILAGAHSQTPQMLHMLSQAGGLTNDSVRLMGWVEDVSSFYNSISVYVQPSVTEGFGIEVLEAMAHGRPVVCSDGAGADDVTTPECAYSYTASRPWLISLILEELCKSSELEAMGAAGRKAAGNYAWDKIRERYAKLWKEML